MPIQTRLIEYTHNDTLLEGYLAWDDSHTEARPGVLVAHPWAGRLPFVEDKARKLAELGYVGFALDMYGKGIIGNGVEECSALMTAQTDDRPALQARMLAALNTLRDQPEVNAAQVAAMGYCFGGLCVLDLARTGEDFAGAVSFHGLLSAPGNTAEKINAPILALHGYDDPMATPDQLDALQQELTTAKADWQTHAFGGVMHAFTNPAANDVDFGTVYDAKSDRRSWVIAQDFLKEVFGEFGEL